ncbi:MAG: VTT domain-containing protein [Chloroflexi bacterium]|nr:VTT domain-containing protein [Chloroflexota bacterium]
MDSEAAVEATPRPPFLLRRATLRAAAQMAATLVLSSIIAYVLLRYHETLSLLGSWNYLSVFIVEVASSATIIIPAPGQVYVFALSDTLNPALVGLIGGAGAALGELSGYLLGASGHPIVRSGRLYEQFHRLSGRWGGAILFLFAALPVPFDFAGIWAGTVRYPLWRFLAYVTPGKVIKVTAIGLAGYYSAPWLLKVVG